MHYHLVINRVRQPDQYADAEEARDVLGAELERLQAEKQNQGCKVQMRKLGNGYLATWTDGTLSGWQVVESTACAMTDHALGPELESVRVEVFGLSADPEGIWLISGGAWAGGPVAAGAEPHEVVRALLAERGALDDARVLHSTSWRAEGESVILTYVAALACPHVRQHWPQAERVHPALADAYGPPATHAATEPPTPRHADVLMHALRHLEFLRQHDATASAAMGADWRQHLQAFAPALAGMYAAEHVPEILTRAV
jgi:hypothetical protein